MAPEQEPRLLTGWIIYKYAIKRDFYNILHRDEDIADAARIHNQCNFSLLHRIKTQANRTAYYCARWTYASCAFELRWTDRVGDS